MTNYPLVVLADYTALNGCAITHGAWHLGQYTVVARVRLENVILLPPPDNPFISFDSCTLIGCDLRAMSWQHFRYCYIRRAEGDLRPDTQLPTHGDINEARMCSIEIDPGHFHRNA